jgi:hypothetical protein
MNKRQRPYFSDQQLQALTDSFKASMDESELYYDDNLLDAVRSYAKSAKLDYENALLHGVIAGEYRMLYTKESATYGAVVPTVIEEYKKKYPQGMEAIKKDPELHRKAMQDSADMDLKGAVERYRDIEKRLQTSLGMVSHYGRKNAGKIAPFLKAPFEERSTKVMNVESAVVDIPDDAEVCANSPLALTE